MHQEALGSGPVASLEKRINHPSFLVQKMALSLALPLTFPPLRIPSCFRSTATAVAKIYDIGAVDFTNPTDDTTGWVVQGAYFMAVSRNPLRACIKYLPQGAGGFRQTYVGGLWFQPSPGISGFTQNWEASEQLGTTGDILMPVKIPIAWVQDTTSSGSPPSQYHPHYERLFAVEHNGEWGIWVDGTQNHMARISWLNVVSPDAYTIHVYKFNGDVWQYLVSQKSTNASLDIFLKDYGYYSFRYTGPANCKLAGTMFVSADSFGHWPLPDIAEILNMVSNIAVTSMAAMLSCSASMLNAEGSMAGVQTPANSPWYDVLNNGNNNPVSAILRYKGSTQSRRTNLKDGIYGFGLPDDNTDFVMKPLTRENSQGVVCYENPLQNSSSWLVIAALTGATTIGLGALGGDLYSTCAWGVELQTNSCWFNSMPVSIAVTNAEFQLALELLARTEQWHENPLHFSDVIAAIRGFGRRVFRVLPHFAAALAPVYPAASGVLTAVGGLASAIDSAVRA